jgi:hypothetical protein
MVVIERWRTGEMRAVIRNEVFAVGNLAHMDGRACDLGQRLKKCRVVGK